MGPSFPRGSPDEHEKIMPIALQTSVLNRTNRGMFRPFRKHLISGMPVKVFTSPSYVSKVHELAKAYKPDPALRGSR